MPLLFGILVSAGVIFAIFAVTVGRGGSMTQFQPDWPGQALPQDRPVRASDLADAKFSVAFRGYRMAEVDEALDRLAVEIAQRDERIQQLTGQPFDGAPPVALAAASDPAVHQPGAYDTAVYQPHAQDPYAQTPNAHDPNATPYAYDPGVYQPPQPPAEPPAYQPHGYPPGVLDGGGHPTQPIPPATDPGTTDPGTAHPGTEG
ncbi:MAG TPA: DivIVA domain-containing protein [Acidothermaceae bacterium]